MAAVRLGRELDLEIGVRCGGHSVLGHARPGRRSDDRPDPDGRGERRPGAPARAGAGRRAARRTRSGRAAPRSGHDRGQRLSHRRRRAHPRRRHGLARPPVRPDVRQRRRRSRWSPPTATSAARERDRAPRPVLGAARRRRQFRGRDRVRVPAPPDRHRERSSPSSYFALEDGAPALRGLARPQHAAPRAATFIAWVGVQPVATAGRPVASVGYVWVGDPDARPRSCSPALRALGRPIAERVDRARRTSSCSATRGHARGPRAPPVLEGPLLPVADATRRSRRSCCAARPTATASSCPRRRLQAYGGAIAEVPDDATPRSATATRCSSSSRRRRWIDPAEDDGPDRARPGATPPRWTRSPAACTSTR